MHKFILCILFWIIFIPISINAVFLYDTYTKIFCKYEYQSFWTGIETNFKINEQFSFVTSYETALAHFNREDNDPNKFRLFEPEKIDFSLGINYRIDDLILSFRHSCMHSLDDYQELYDRANSRNKISLEF